MTSEREKPTLPDYFWTALTLELAVRGMHPDMTDEQRLMVTARYGERRLWRLPLDVAVRMLGMRASLYLRETGLLGGVDVPDKEEEETAGGTGTHTRSL